MLKIQTRKPPKRLVLGGLCILESLYLRFSEKSDMNQQLTKIV